MCDEWPFTGMLAKVCGSESEERSLDTTQPGLDTDKLHQTQILVRHQRPLCPEFPSLKLGDPGHDCNWSLMGTMLMGPGDLVTWPQLSDDAMTQTQGSHRHKLRQRYNTVQIPSRDSRETNKNLQYFILSVSLICVVFRGLMMSSSE